MPPIDAIFGWGWRPPETLSRLSGHDLFRKPVPAFRGSRSKMPAHRIGLGGRPHRAPAFPRKGDSDVAPNSGLVLWRRRARRALAHIVFACTRRRAGRRSGAILRLRHCDHTAVRAHPDRIKATIGRLVHPVLAGEGGGDALDRTFHAERLAAAN